MSVTLYAMTTGWLRVRLKLFLDGEDGELWVPVPCFLLKHPKGLALYDTGLHIDVQHDQDGRLGEISKYWTIRYQPGEDLAARLAALDVDPGEIDYLINSHLHFDHAGGNDAVPNADLVIQAREWRAGMDPDLAQANGFMAQDYDLGHRVIQIEGEHDVFGDASVLTMPSYGHTPGHQSLRVRLDSGEVLLTGDACYLRRTLEEMRLPKFCHDREQMLESLRRIQALKDRGARIFYGHDPDFWATVPQAPAPVV